jgi:hypothetical protein
MSVVNPNEHSNSGDGIALPVGGPYHGVIEWVGHKTKPKADPKTGQETMVTRLIVRIRAWYNQRNELMDGYAPLIESFATSGEHIKYLGTLARMAGCTQPFEAEDEQACKAALEGRVVAFTVKQNTFKGDTRMNVGFWKERKAEFVTMIEAALREQSAEPGAGPAAGGPKSPDDDVPF